MKWGVAPISPMELLRKLEGQLQAAGTPAGSNLPGGSLGDRAFLTEWPDDLLAKNPRAKQFVAIRPNRFPLWQSVIQGAGTPLIGSQFDPTATGFNAVVSLVCFAQNNADPENWSKQATTEDVLSCTSLALRTMKAVQFWTPCSDALLTNCYLREPARVTDGGFGLGPKKIGDGWWTVAPLDLELKLTSSF